MKKFISCDWGTSTFRLRLVDATRVMVVDEVVGNLGIAATHALAIEKGFSGENRFLFYRSFIQDQLERLQEKVNISLHNLPLIISGMASSNIGMVELPYKELPFAIDGSDLHIKTISATPDFQHDIIIISGARTDDDIMRGEETQLIGCYVNMDDEHIYIFPGTHSKHIRVRDRLVIDFKTYMTGEFFQILSHDSILSKSVQEGNGTLTGMMLKNFEEGVTQGTHSNILNQAFLIRTRHILNHVSKEGNFYYLSGLLIGTELHALTRSTVPVVLVSTELMKMYYITALNKLGVAYVEAYDADVALVKGHSMMYQRFYDR